MAFIKSIDLNCDLGESFDGKTNDHDEELMPYISSCNIACGYHSGNAKTIEQTIILANNYNVAIGAHPSYYDRLNFGRKSMKVPKDKLIAQITEQVNTVKTIGESYGTRLHHVKPHGALYNDMASDLKLSKTVLEAIAKIDDRILIYGLAHSEVEKACQEIGLTFIGEAFSDRRYTKDLTLLSRSIENAVIKDTEDVLKQILLLTKYFVMDIEGTIHDINAQTICLHSDTPNALQLADAIFQYFKNKNIEVVAP